MTYLRLIPIILTLLLLHSCGSEDHSLPFDASSPLFQALRSVDTQIYFKNEIKETAQNNLTNNNYIYSGGGVAVGDLNNDDLPDLVFVSNEGMPGLYINEGKMKFKNISFDSGLKKVGGWSTGVSIVDINDDGYEDIYICRGGENMKSATDRTNLLYINNGDLTFTEKAAEYGLADAAVSTLGAFFDYDLDGDLDCYVLNVPLGTPRVPYGDMRKWRKNPDPNREKQDSDHLYRNNGDGTFTDVTRQAGISNWAYGLGLTFGDVNRDGYPDIYVTNDFEVDNFYFENNGNGTFTEKLKAHFPHCSFFAMGVDMADINNDGYLDMYEVEMLPESRSRAIVNMKPMDRYAFEDLLKVGMQPQYMRNSLQINRGNGYFSDIAQFAGVNKTDWSWGTLLVDLDDDGHKDIFVANGIMRDAKDRDFQHEGNRLTKESQGRMSLDQMISLVPSNPIKNYVFQNKGNLKFEKVMDKWGFGFKGYSNGVAYGDLDLDGDLDLVVSNMVDEPFIYRNTSVERGKNVLNFKFKGAKGNPHGIGGKIKIHTKDGIQYQELFTARGYQSNSEPIVHFGLGDITTVDKVEIIWWDGSYEVQENITANQLITLQKSNATQRAPKDEVVTSMLKNITPESRINFKHSEAYYDDFKTEILLPHKMSQNGPALATADVDGDGLEDIYVGGAANQFGGLFLQKKLGQFSQALGEAFRQDAKYEDIGATFFDADQDGDLDLYVVSGSNEFEKNKSMYQDRLYKNDGKGNFTKATLPTIDASGSCVVAADYDGDGDQDLFVGGRVVPQEYPRNPKSYLLQNNGGTFQDVTSKIAPDLQKAGMISSASWTDIDGDGDQDLVAAGEWTPIMVWENKEGRFADASDKFGLANTEGWWSCIKAMDIDGDGDQDFLAGNIGLNHKFKATEDKPFQVFCDDFDDSGTPDIVLAFHQDDKVFPVRGRDCSSEQMPFLTEKFPTFASFGNATLDEVYGKEKLEKSLSKQAKLFKTVLLVNEGGTFTKKVLPSEAQFSAVNGAVFHDFNQDGKKELLLAGNMFQTEAETSRADAGIGLMLHVDEAYNFEIVPTLESGFFVPGDVKAIQLLNATTDNPIVVVANNDGYLQLFGK